MIFNARRNPSSLIGVISHTPEHRINLLRESELKFRQYDESAFSIVPSRMSSRMSVSTYRRSSVEILDMVYKLLSFENDLFTAMVYKRNYRRPTSSSVIHSKVAATGKANQPNRMRRNSATKVEEAEVVQDTPFTQPNRMRRNSATKVEEAEVVQDTPFTQPNLVQELMANAKRGYEPVHAVAVDGNVELMEELLAGGAVINEHTADDLKWTPLHLAAKYGHAPMTRLLLQKGAHVHSVSGDYLGSRPIHYACKAGSLEVVSILLDYGATVNFEDRTLPQPLYCAAKAREQPDMIEFLSSRGAIFNGESPDGRTPLHVACEQGYVLNIRILLALYTKAGLELPENILFTAVRSAKPSAVEKLLEHGLDPNIDDGTHFGFKTPLHYALIQFSVATATCKESSASEHQEALKTIVQILLKYKANVRGTDKHGNQAIRILMRRRYRIEDIDDQYKEVFDLLLTSGADLNALDELQRSPLSKAAAYLDYSMVSFLLSRGANHLSESRLSSLANYYENNRYSEYPLISQADAEKMMEFLAKKAAESIC